MKTKEARRYEMLARVREFEETHRDQFPESSLGGQAFAAVAAAVAQLNEHSRVRMSKRRAGQGARRQVRASLLEMLEAVERTARVIGEKSPGFDDALHLPYRPSDQLLLTTARTFVHEAEANAAQFVSYRMPEGFVAELRGLIEEFEQAIRSLEAGKDGQVASRTAIDNAFESAFAAGRELDVIVANQFHEDPVALAVWERARKVDYGKRLKRNKAAAVSTPSDVTPAPEAPDAATGGVP